MSVLHRGLKSLSLAASLLALAGPSQAAVAANPEQLVFHFFGTCSDCTLNSPAGAPIATLLLDGEYILGAEIEVADIVSFSYVGSNLVDPYTVNGDAALIFDANAEVHIYSASGTMDDNPGAKNFSIVFIDGLGFHSDTGGTWYTCARGPAGFYSGTCNLTFNNDIGTGQWNAPVPEPATWGLMALGLAALGWRRHRA